VPFVDLVAVEGDGLYNSLVVLLSQLQWRQAVLLHAAGCEPPQSSGCMSATRAPTRVAGARHAPAWQCGVIDHLALVACLLPFPENAITATIHFASLCRVVLVLCVVRSFVCAWMARHDLTHHYMAF
jgi:hypothetical protein